ncbi:MAG TPA: hypothetical protein VFY72_12920 [Beijerinckiaceae bacterium]|jgi:hypothetical protein|nr:hypothetical protein [Beijerinckiaceae bacterium]
MADPASTRVEPHIGPVPVASALATDELRAAVESAPAADSRPVPVAPAHDQLSRIEDKAARIEEKYARSEAILLRVGTTVEAATSRMNEVASQAELAALRDQVRRLPGTGALLMVAVVTALLTAGLVYLVLRYGLPGAGALPR